MYYFMFQHKTITESIKLVEYNLLSGILVTEKFAFNTSQALASGIFNNFGP